MCYISVMRETHNTQEDGMNTPETTINLQYQLSTGSWIDCDDRADEFLARCAACESMTREQVLLALDSGKTLRNAPADWYSNCRYEPAPRPAVEIDLVKCSCGCMVPKNLVMNTSTGSSCTDCYDRMSN